MLFIAWIVSPFLISNELNNLTECVFRKFLFIVVCYDGHEVLISSLFQ